MPRSMSRPSFVKGVRRAAALARAWWLVGLGAMLAAGGCVRAERYAVMEKKARRCAKKARKTEKELDGRRRELGLLHARYERLAKRVRSGLKPTVQEIELVRVQRRDERRAEKLAARLRRTLKRFVASAALTVSEVDGLLVLETRGDVFATNDREPTLLPDGTVLLKNLARVAEVLQPWPVDIRVQVPCVTKDKVPEAWAQSAGLAALLAQALIGMGVASYRVRAVALGPRRKPLGAGPGGCDERVSIVLVPSSDPLGQLR